MPGGWRQPWSSPWTGQRPASRSGVRCHCRRTDRRAAPARRKADHCPGGPPSAAVQSNDQQGRCAVAESPKNLSEPVTLGALASQSFDLGVSVGLTVTDPHAGGNDTPVTPTAGPSPRIRRGTISVTQQQVCVWPCRRVGHASCPSERRPKRAGSARVPVSCRNRVTDRVLGERT